MSDSNPRKETELGPLTQHQHSTATELLNFFSKCNNKFFIQIRARKKKKRLDNFLAKNIFDALNLFGAATRQNF